jgi:glycosyltransferase involved in cell wall biosynthesis
MAATGHRVDVVSGDGEAWPERAGDDGAAVHRVGRIWPLYHYEEESDAVLGAIKSLAWAMPALLAGGTFDVVLCYGWHAALAGFALREWSDAPVVVYLHGTTAAGEGTHQDASVSHVAEMERWAADQADAVACPSELALAELGRRYGLAPGKTLALPPACDASRIGPGDTNLDDFRSLLAERDELVVLFVGELSADNGPDVLAKATEALRTGRFRFLFAGDGSMADELMATVERVGAADRCVFAGHVGDRVLGCLYRCADVVVAPARRSASGMAAIEGTANGTTVIGADVGALGSLIADGVNGLKVDPGDPDALAGALSWAADNRDRMAEMGSQARTVAAERFSWEQSAETLVKAVHSLRAGQETGAQPAEA